MFNIEEKIKKWYENQKSVPIVKNESKNNNEVIYTTSNKSSNTIRDANELKNSIIKKQKEYDKLKSEIVYEFETNPNNNYSDESLEKKADQMAKEEFVAEYDKEDLKNKSNVSNLNFKKSQIISDKNSKEGEIYDNYDEIINKTTDKAIKNGVSRSSIFNGETEKYTNIKDNEISKLTADADALIKNNETLMEFESQRHENALNELDIKKADTKNKKLNALKEERQKLVDEGILTGEYKFNQDYKSPEMLDIRKQILNDVLSYYSSMDKKLAKSEYEKDTELHAMLGELEPAIRTYITGKGYYYK